MGVFLTLRFKPLGLILALGGVMLTLGLAAGTRPAHAYTFCNLEKVKEKNVCIGNEYRNLTAIVAEAIDGNNICAGVAQISGSKVVYPYGWYCKGVRAIMEVPVTHGLPALENPGPGTDPYTIGATVPG
jgi:hypothetical protein